MPGIPTRTVRIGDVTVGGGNPLVLFAGPCQIESRSHTLAIAERVSSIAKAVGMPLVFKASFDKANRSSVDSPRGAGMERGLEILAEIRAATGLPVLSDLHTSEQCAPAARTLDALQIPAFLSRQTDLLLAAGETGKPVLVKKGPFLAPEDMENVAGKIASTGNHQILLCERGTSFGYHTLVVDLRSLAVMRSTGYPVVFDATHSVQSPGGLGAASGGDRKFAPILARAAVAAGTDAIFLETHDDPDRAPSDGPVMLPLDELPDLLETLLRIDRALQPRP